MDLKGRGQEGAVRITLHSVAVLQLGHVDPVHRVGKNHFLAGCHVGNVHAALGIGRHVGRHDLIVVEPYTKVKVGVKIHPGTLDGLAQQKLLVDNLRIPTCELGNDVKWFKETQNALPRQYNPKQEGHQ